MRPANSRIRKRRLYAKVIISLVIVVGLGYLANFFLRDSRFNIREVVVTTDGEIATTSVPAFIDADLAGSQAIIFSRGNIFTYSKSSIIDKLKETFPEIKAVEMTASIEGMLNVRITEYPDQYFWCRAQVECFALINLLAQSGIIVNKVIFLTEGDIKMLTDKGWYFLYNSKDIATVVQKRLLTAVSSEVLAEYDNLEYLDLRFGNKVFYKLRK